MDVRTLSSIAGREGQTLIAQQFFIYTSGRSAAGIAAGGGVQNFQISILADSDFLIEKLTFNSDVAAAAQTDGTRILPNVNVLLTNTGNGNQLMNVQVPVTGLFGTGQLPFILPVPYLLPATSTLQGVLTSYEAAAVDFVTLNFIGRKLYWSSTQQTRRV